MIRINIKEQVWNLVLLLIVQLPLVHRLVIFESAFGFFYVGFILLLPRTLSRSQLMFAGFLAGLLVDIFTNTPGIHASASVFVMFIRVFWLDAINNDKEEVINLNIVTLKKTGFISFLFPLVFVHHLYIFLLENGGFHLFGIVLGRSFSSAIFSTVIVFVVNYVVTSTKR